MTKIDIVSGFLGAGKTTLIKKLLNEVFADEQVVLIENEFGEIGIDGGFLKEAGIEIREMNSGCICCSLVGDFGASLKEVMETYHPDRILIEPSGVGKLSDVIKAVRDVQDAGELKLNSFTTVVDVTKCKMYMRNFGEFFNNQIQYAGAIILSRTDKAPAEKVKAAVELLRTLNEKSPIITTPLEKLPGDKVLEAMEHVKSLEEELMEETICPECGKPHGHDLDGHECGHDHHDHECSRDHHDHDHECSHDHHDHDHECSHGHHAHGSHDHEHSHDHHSHECDHDHHDHDHHEHGCGHEHSHHGEHSHGHHDECGCGHHHDHHHADEVFTSWGKETANVYTQEEIADILKKLESDPSYGTVLRAKGMVEGKDGQWIYFDMVPQEHEVRTGAPEYTGRICVIGAKLDTARLESLFHI